MVNISEAVKIGAEILSAYNNARLEAEILLKDVLNRDSIFLVTHSSDVLLSADFDKFLLHCKRRAAGEPSAYITGKKEFMSLEFEVDKNVLIPRPETELTVEIIIDKYSKKNAYIADICTGSGAIACSLAKYLQDAHVTATDISKAAIDIAQKNAKRLGVSERVEFMISDALADRYKFEKRFDVIVSNPPYIETDTVKTLETCVKDYEPVIALDGGTDGLEFYRKISKNVKIFVNPGAMIIFEIGYNQGADVGNILYADGWKDIEVIKDYSSNDRIVLAYDDQLSK